MTALFIRFCQGESVSTVISSFVKSPDQKIASIATKTLENPPDLEEFRTELKEAVTDLIKDGVGEDFKSFVDHYMLDSIEQTSFSKETPLGEDRSTTATIKDENSTWIQGFICFNLCLYIKAFGLENLKKCRICDKIFDHKGKYAVYCSDVCKKQKLPKAPKDGTT
jgi:hypothetical protein